MEYRIAHTLFDYAQERAAYLSSPRLLPSGKPNEELFNFEKNFPEAQA